MRRLGCAGLMMLLLAGVLLAAVSPAVVVVATARRGKRRAPYSFQGALSVQTALFLRVI